jgi:hypothetical protein
MAARPRAFTGPLPIQFPVEATDSRKRVVAVVTVVTVVTRRGKKNYDSSSLSQKQVFQNQPVTTVTTETTGAGDCHDCHDCHRRTGKKWHFGRAVQFHEAKAAASPFRDRVTGLNAWHPPPASGHVFIFYVWLPKSKETLDRSRQTARHRNSSISRWVNSLASSACSSSLGCRPRRWKITSRGLRPSSTRPSGGRTLPANHVPP